MFNMTQEMYSLFRDLWKGRIDDDFIGRHGERLSYEAVKKARQFKKHGVVYRNVYLPKGDGEFTEIDLIVLTKKGIFVFETKNVLGTVTGDERDKYWQVTQGDSMHDLYNPVRQNEVHVRALKELLNVSHSVFNVVMFSERARLGEIYTPTENVVVIRRDCLKSFVSRNWKNMKDYFDDETLQSWMTKLLPYTHVGENVKAKHLADVRRKHH